MPTSQKLAPKTTFSVRELQRHLAAALRTVQQGLPVEITSRGKGVAVMVPVVAAGGGPRDADERALRALAARHLVAQIGQRGPIRLRTWSLPSGTVAAFLESRR